MSALFGAKTIGFFEIYVVSARTGGVEPVRTTEGVHFSRFCADVLYGQPLIYFSTSYSLSLKYKEKRKNNKDTAQNNTNNT